MQWHSCFWYVSPWFLQSPKTPTTADISKANSKTFCQATNRWSQGADLDLDLGRQLEGFYLENIFFRTHRVVKSIGFVDLLCSASNTFYGWSEDLVTWARGCPAYEFQQRLANASKESDMSIAAKKHLSVPRIHALEAFRAKQRAAKVCCAKKDLNTSYITLSRSYMKAWTERFARFSGATLPERNDSLVLPKNAGAIAGSAMQEMIQRIGKKTQSDINASGPTTNSVG